MDDFIDDEDSEAEADAEAMLEDDIDAALDGAIDNDNKSDNESTPDDADTTGSGPAHAGQQQVGKANPRLGWFKAKKKISGRILVVLATPAVTKRGILVTRPNIGVNTMPKEVSDFRRTYTRIQPDEAKEMWDIEHERSGRFCVHADERSPCKFGSTCARGARLQNMSVITGSVVAVWTALEELLTRNEAHLTKVEQRCVARIPSKRTVYVRPLVSMPQALLTWVWL
jgi:hypothetical protein